MHLAPLIIAELILTSDIQSNCDLSLQKNAAAGRWKQGKVCNVDDANGNDKLTVRETS